MKSIEDQLTMARHEGFMDGAKHGAEAERKRWEGVKEALAGLVNQIEELPPNDRLTYTHYKDACRALKQLNP